MTIGLNEDYLYFLHSWKSGFLYSPPARTASECWHNAMVWDQVTGGVDEFDKSAEYFEKWKKTMKKQGWRARQFSVQLM